MTPELRELLTCLLEYFYAELRFVRQLPIDGYTIERKCHYLDTTTTVINRLILAIDRLDKEHPL